MVGSELFCYHFLSNQSLSRDAKLLNSPMHLEYFQLADYLHLFVGGESRGTILNLSVGKFHLGFNQFEVVEKFGSPSLVRFTRSNFRFHRVSFAAGSHLLM
jgi:hypothetical protein